MKQAGVYLVVLGLAVAGIFTCGGCATGDVAHPVSMGCVDPLAADCDDPSAYPSLRAMLPTAPPGMTPPPKLFVPIPEGASK